MTSKNGKTPSLVVVVALIQMSLILAMNGDVLMVKCGRAKVVGMKTS